MLLVSLLAITVPHFVLGSVTAAVRWNMSFRVATFLGLLLLTLNAKRLWRLARRMRVRKERKGNQHTYEGIPLDDFVTYLFQNKAFTTDAISELGLSQRKWRKIADELENGDVLRRGENNSRILNEDATREIVVKQLRDGFPLTWDIHSSQWIEKVGTYQHYLADREREERKNREHVEKLERKEDRMRKNIARMREEQSVFQSIMAQ